MRWRNLGILLLGLCIGFPTVTSADTIPVLQGAAVLEADGGVNLQSYFLQIGGIDFAGEGTPPALHPYFRCFPCAVGTSLDVDATFAGPDVLGVSFEQLPGGAVGHTVYLDGVLNFDGGTAIVTAPFGLIDAPVRVTGHLSGFLDPSRTGATLFDLDFTGNGKLRMGMEAVPGTPLLRSLFATYTFTSPAQTPEPASLLLLGSGAAWIVRRTRHNRRQARG